MVKFQKKILANGLTVLFEKRDVDVTTVMLAARFGAAYETENEKGIAHFIEHLCFKGTEKRNTTQIAEEVEQVGGILNAFTHEELTAYFVKLPSNYWGLAMDVIFDIYFNPQFPEEEVERERKVILEEIKMYKDNPRAHTVEKLKDLLYKKPFGMSITGTEKTVSGLTRNYLLEKHRQIYCPSNSVLCVVGNNDFEDVLKMAEKFSVSRSFKILSRPNVILVNGSQTERRENLEQANVAIGFHFPLASDKEKSAAHLFNAIFGEGMSSKLFKEVREKRGLAYAVKSELDLGKNYGYMTIYIGTDKSKSEEVIKICVEEFHKLAEISLNELEQAKIQVVGNKKVEAEGSNETAINLLLNEIWGKAEDYYSLDTEIHKVKLEDIQKLAKKSEYSYFILSP